MGLLKIIFGNGKYATFFDKPSADRAWDSLNQQKGETTRKLEYNTDYDLEGIAISLSENPKTSQNHLTSGKIGIVEKNTRLYLSKNDETQLGAKNEPDKSYREVHFVIPKGARLNGKIYRNRVVKTIPLFKDPKVSELFANILEDHYNNAQITEIYNILSGSSIPIPEPKRSLLNRVGIPAAVSAAILATAIGGPYISKMAMDNPKYRVEVENAAKIPDTNIYNARYTKL